VGSATRIEAESVARAERLTGLAVLICNNGPHLTPVRAHIAGTWGAWMKRVNGRAPTEKRDGRTTEVSKQVVKATLDVYKNKKDGPEGG
jgi:hypothetical protein